MAVNERKNFQFVFLLAVILVITNGLMWLIPKIWGMMGLSSESAECLAWLLITSTYFGSIPAAFIFGKGRDYQHSFYQIYGTVLFSISGDILGLTLMGFVLRQKLLFGVVSTALIVHHFTLRRGTVECKQTPHLGQRGTDEEKWREIVLAHTCDFYQVLLLAAFFYFTQHPIWILGCVIFIFQYFISVRAHKVIHDIPKTYGLALLILFAMCLVVWPVCSWWGIIRRYDIIFIGVLISGGLGQILTLFLKNDLRTKIFHKNIPPIGFVIISTLLICGLVGILVLPPDLDVSVANFLLGKPLAKDIVSYSIILIFVATLFNSITILGWHFYRMQENENMR